MKLIADSGATSIDWCLIDGNQVLKQFKTQGINANYLSEEEIQTIISQASSLLDLYKAKIKVIHFYGAGCAKSIKQEMMCRHLKTISQNAAIFVEGDTLGAAISIFGEDKGICCILGTGSNTCIYEQRKIKKSILSLGYIFGDEGSGTYIGKMILKNFLKNKFPVDLEETFFQTYQKNKSEIITDLYAAQKTNAYFSQFSRFASEHIEHPYINELVKECFRTFFNEQVLPFEEHKTWPIGFVGSVAKVFEKQLYIVAEEYHINIYKIIQNPIIGLIEYYQQHE